MTALPSLPFAPRPCLLCRIPTRQREVLTPEAPHPLLRLGIVTAAAIRFPLCQHHPVSITGGEVLTVLSLIFFADFTHHIPPPPERSSLEFEAMGIEVFE